MLLRQLLARLERLQDEHGDDVEVRIAIPRSWPLFAAVTDVRYAGHDADPDYPRPAVWISGE